MAIQRRSNHSNPFIGAPAKVTHLHWKPTETTPTEDQNPPRSQTEEKVQSPPAATKQNVALLGAFVIFMVTVGVATVWYFVR